MDKLNAIIGNNLRAIRRERRLSLDQIAELTGVSKAMLGQIERGESSPTVATLWKIVNGLKVSFSSIIEEKTEGMHLVCQRELVPLLEQEGKMKIYPLFPFDNRKGFELFTIILEPGCHHESEAHNEGVEEYVLVVSGNLEIKAGHEICRLGPGDALRFAANRPHSYTNPAPKAAVTFQNLIFYS